MKEILVLIVAIIIILFASGELSDMPKFWLDKFEKSCKDELERRDKEYDMKQGDNTNDRR